MEPSKETAEAVAKLAETQIAKNAFALLIEPMLKEAGIGLSDATKFIRTPLMLLGSMAIAVAPTLIVVAMGYGSVPAVLAAVALSIVVLCFGAAWESEHRR